jgi:membrane associated rhomboid family serine protease
MTTASVGFHCPECARTGRQKVYTRANWSDALRRPFIVQALIGINVAVWVAGLVMDQDGLGGFIDEGGLIAFLVADGEWYRIVTSGFLHSTSPMHLLFNMLALFNLGSVLEPAMGRGRFVAAYVFSLLAASVGVLVLSPDNLTVGASGAVFGLMGVLVIAQRLRGMDVWSTGLGSVLAINLLITFAIPRISIGGHVGGLVGGIAAGWLLLDVGPKSFRQPWVPTAIAGGLSVALFVASVAVASAA